MIPDTTSFEKLLSAIETRIWEDRSTEELEYMLTLIDDLYVRSVDVQTGALNGNLTARNPIMEFHPEP